MKKLITISVILLNSLIAQAQETLQHVTNTPVSEIRNISLNDSNKVFFNTDYNSYSYKCQDTLESLDITGVNNIYNGEFLIGDTLSAFINSINTYYGMDDLVFPHKFLTGNNTKSYTITPNLNNNGIYILDENGDYFEVLGYAPYNLIPQNDFDYFEVNGEEYLSIIVNGEMHVYIFSLNEIKILSTNDYITSTTFYNNELYYSTSTKVVKLTNLDSQTNNYITFDTEYTYNVFTTIIHEFEFDSTGYIYVATTNGVYSNADCNITPLDLSTGESSTLENIVIYPNPAISQLKFNGSKENSSYKIFDISGKIVETGLAHTSIDVKNLKNGIYFLQIESYEIQKFVKK